jgi:hypothetical protein
MDSWPGLESWELATLGSFLNPETTVAVRSADGRDVVTVTFEAEEIEGLTWAAIPEGQIPRSPEAAQRLGRTVRLQVTLSGAPSDAACRLDP